MNRVFKSTLIETEITVAGLREQVDALCGIIHDIEQHSQVSDDHIYSNIKNVEISLKKIRKYIIQLTG